MRTMSDWGIIRLVWSGATLRAIRQYDTVTWAVMRNGTETGRIVRIGDRQYVHISTAR